MRSWPAGLQANLRGGSYRGTTLAVAVWPRNIGGFNSECLACGKVAELQNKIDEYSPHFTG